MNHIFRLVLCWFEGSQSGNNNNVIFDMARHHLPTDFLVFRHWQVQPRVRILNLPRGENTQSSGIGTKTFNCPSPRIRLKVQENQFEHSHWNRTSDRPCSQHFLLCNKTNLDMACIPSQSTCQEHSISVKRCGFIQNRTSLARAESALTQHGRWEHLSPGIFWDKGLFIVTHPKPYPPLFYLRTFPEWQRKGLKAVVKGMKSFLEQGTTWGLWRANQGTGLKPKYKGSCWSRLMGLSQFPFVKVLKEN